MENTPAHSIRGQRIAEARQVSALGDELFAKGNDAAAIEQYHRALIAIGAKVQPQPYVGYDSTKSYADVRIEDIADPLLAGDLLSRIAGAYLRGFFARGGRQKRDFIAPGGVQLNPDPFGLSHGHGTAANEASIRILKKGLDLFLEKGLFVCLHERREIGHLLRRAYDLQIDDLIDHAALLREPGNKSFLFGKVLGYRSLTLREALWLRRGSFLKILSEEQRQRVPPELIASLESWSAAGLRYGYLRDALLSEMSEKEARKDVTEQLLAEGKRARAEVKTRTEQLQADGTRTDKEIHELIRKLAWFPDNPFGGGFILKNSLTKGDLLIQYHETPRHLLGFVYDPAYDSLENNVSLEVLANDTAAVADLVDDYCRRLKTKSSDWRTRASNLYSLLLEPFLRLLDGKERLFVVPSGSLNTLPFQSLINSTRLKLPPVVLLPHAEILGAFTLTSDRTRALVIGISNFGTQPCLPGAEAEAISVAAHLARRGAKGWKRMILGAIPRAIASGVNDDVTLLLGSRGEANKCRILEEMPKYGIVHIATHATFDRLAMNSAVLVPAKDNVDVPITGFDLLSPEMRLDGALVVLSACNTGGLQIDRGEDPLGLASALLVAGAQAVVVSHWPVADRATQLLMARFYDRLARGETVDHALAGAARWLRRWIPRYRHPYYWAPFVVIGDGRWRLPIASATLGSGRTLAMR